MTIGQTLIFRNKPFIYIYIKVHGYNTQYKNNTYATTNVYLVLDMAINIPEFLDMVDESEFNVR